LKQLYIVKTVEVIKAYGEDYAINKYMFDSEPLEEEILECVDKDKAPRYELWYYLDNELQFIKAVDMKELEFGGVKLGGVVDIQFLDGYAASLHITFDGGLNWKPFEGIKSHFYHSKKIDERLKSEHSAEDKELIDAASFQAYGRYSDLYMHNWKNPSLELSEASPFIDTDEIDKFFAELDLPEQKL
jgi:hypothetical protein